jgi:hypothetical protein
MFGSRAPAAIGSLPAEDIVRAILGIEDDPKMRVEMVSVLGQSSWSQSGILLGYLTHDPVASVKEIAQDLFHSLYPAIDLAIGTPQMVAPSIIPETAAAEPSPTLQAEIVRRYSELTFKHQVETPAVGDLSFVLRVKATRSTSPPVEVFIPHGKEHATVLVHAFSAQFSISEPNRWIKVYRQGDSDEAQFVIRAQQAGDGDVGLLIFDESRMIGSMSVHLRASTTKDGLSLVQEGEDIFLDPGSATSVRSIGHTILVTLSPENSRIHYQFLDPQDHDGELRPQFISLGFSPQSFNVMSMQKALKELRGEVEYIERNLKNPQRLGPRDEADALDGLEMSLEGAGLLITDDIFSDDMKAMIARCDPGTVINWVVRDHDLETIPWELAWHPVMDSALNEHIVLVRAPTSRNGQSEAQASGQEQVRTPSETHSWPRRIVQILGDGVAEDANSLRDFDLSSIVQADGGKYELESNFDSRGRTSWSITDVAKHVRGAHVIYFLCHGIVEEDQQFYLRLGGESFYRLTITKVRALKLGATRPLVFVNSCSSDAATFSTGGLTTLGRNFMRAGASAYIGTLAPVTTRSAVQFARVFFESHLTKGQPIPQSIFAARQSLKGKKDPTRLLYTVYGDLDSAGMKFM